MKQALIVSAAIAVSMMALQSAHAGCYTAGGKIVCTGGVASGGAGNGFGAVTGGKTQGGSQVSGGQMNKPAPKLIGQDGAGYTVRKF